MLKKWGEGHSYIVLAHLCANWQAGSRVAFEKYLIESATCTGILFQVAKSTFMKLYNPSGWIGMRRRWWHYFNTMGKYISGKTSIYTMKQ